MGWIKKLGQSISKNPLGATFGMAATAAQNIAGGRPVLDTNDPLTQAQMAALAAAGGYAAFGAGGAAGAGGAGASGGGAGAAGAAGGGSMGSWIPGIMAGAGALLNYGSQRDTNENNLQIAREQMAFQGQMSNTAHQREVEDMKKAGLNPILSAHGGGASSPSGASATMQAPQIDMPSIIQAVSLDQQQQRIDIERQNSQISNAKKMDEIKNLEGKRRLMNKGIIRADAEGEVAGLIKALIQKMKNPTVSDGKNSYPLIPNTERQP